MDVLYDLKLYTFYTSAIYIFLLFLSAYALFRRLGRAPSNVYPPGPPARPLIGNILHFKTRGAWIDLAKFKNKYEVIQDLLDKRASTYSNRPMFTVVSELMGLGQSIPMLPYGKEWRELRKLAHAAFSPSATKKYHTTQENFSAILNLALLNDPTNFFTHIRLAAGQIVLAVTYGLSADIADRKYIVQAEETLEIIGKAAVPGAYLCDFLPIPEDLIGHEYRVKWTAGSMFGGEPLTE
ncbi:hypothetical protein C0993_007647 [Termitomyces sp. T159_Od127]|nr:hypothetical protein C0993_007647 [Termitomyces sp. T159_Od127]